MRGQRDLRLMVTATAICAVGSLITPLGAVRIVFAAPLALFLPGYAITAAAFGGRRLDRLELVPLSVGISLAALVLGSVVLNYTPGGLRGLPWTLLLLLVVLESSRIAARRRRRTRTTARRSGVAMPKVTPAAAIASAGAVAMAITALILAQTTLHADRAFGYTELWMKPLDRSDRVAHIGVSSEQQLPTTYRLEVDFGDGPRPIVRSFTLAPGESRTLSFRLDPSREAVPIQAKLFKRGHPETVYRQVSGWAPALEEAPQ